MYKKNRKNIITLSDFDSLDHDKFKDLIKNYTYLFEDVNFCKDFYSSMTNNCFLYFNKKQKKVYNIPGFSFRGCGSFIANIRNKGETYLDFYCCANEGVLKNNIQEIFKKLNIIYIENLLYAETEEEESKMIKKELRKYKIEYLLENIL